ncbi:MAG: DNA polymerase III subunit beta [Proteobacteria bacterium]|nr:DNA polymerase III subunit beta [Pseudomonadota bacterium]
MKLTIERSVLLGALGHVQSVVERRNTIPILSNVRLESDGGQLRLTATDMDLAIVETVDADVAEAASGTIPAHTFYEIVRKLPEGSEVAIGSQAGEERIEVRAGRSRFSLGTLPVEDFPVMAEGSLPHGFALPVAELRRLIDKTRFAISLEETRYYLNGIYLHAVKNGKNMALRAVATDGHRLARVETALPEGAAEMPGVIIPRKSVTELRKLLDDLTDDVTIALSETKIRFTCAGVVLTSKLIDGTFPDYARVIPEGNDRTMMVASKLFAQAVDRVSTISTEKSRAIKLVIEPGKLTLQASSTDDGSASEELDADYAGEALEIGFNSRYLLDMAQQIDGENMQFCMADGTSPTVVRDDGDPGALYVVMPMRV